MKTYNEIERNCIAINFCLNELRDTMYEYAYSIESLSLDGKFESLLNTMQLIHNDVQDELIRQECGVN